MNADGSDQRQVGNAEAEVFNPVWSPDGQRIAFYATGATGADHVFVMSADGTGPQELAEGVWPSWSPDGSQIIYSGPDGLYVMDTDGTNSERVVAGDAFFGEFAPDGSRIAYIATEADSVAVNIIHSDGSERSTLLRRPAPVW
jgi:Tol biopolymer transport system component